MKLFTLGSLILLSCLLATVQASEKYGGDWLLAREILKRIQAPEFPDVDFSIRDYGAKEGGKIDCTEAIQQAIADCFAAGGGRVVVPKGRWLTGPIHLKSRINLHLKEGSVLLFKTDPKAYLPAVFTRWEGVECYNYSPLIYALDAEDIAVTGSGVLDGQASTENWWIWKGREEYGWKPGLPSQADAVDRLYTMSMDLTPLEERRFGEGDYLRPNFIQPYRCKNVLIEGITLRNSPMWEIHPVLCTNVTVRGVTVISHGPNNDGCNPESCKDVLIEDCVFDTGDDCIAIKSGRNNDGRRVGVPSENIIIRNCQMRDGHGGVVMGSEISGGCRNIFVEDCVMDSPNLERALRIKTNSIRGALVENIFVRNVEVGEVADAVIKVNFLYGEGDAGDHSPIVRNIRVENLTSRKSPHALFIQGYKRSPIRNLHLIDCQFEGVEKPNTLLGVEGLILDRVFQNTGVERNEWGDVIR